MEKTMKKETKFGQHDIEAMAPLEKIALYATLNPEGLPHITFVNSLMAGTPTEMTFGQFVRGQSKWYMQQNPKMGFFILSPQLKRMWFGKALWRCRKDDGPELDRYKAMPMQRYNSYFPINRVHYLDLVETSPGIGIPMASTLKSILLSRLKGPNAAERDPNPILNPYSEALFNRMTSLSFMAFKDTDGFPELIPVFGTRASGSRRLVFHPGPFGKKLEDLTPQTEMAVFTVSMKLESVLVRGTFSGIRSRFGIPAGSIDINWVYNSMPPNAGQIYPEVALKPVTEF